jgi:putative peptidoglycan lipid II flippase
LQAFAFGLVGFSFVKILAPAYFAREDTRTPVRFGLIALAVNFVLSVSLAWYLTAQGSLNAHAGLALAVSVAAILNAVLLYRGLIRISILQHSSGWMSFLLQVLVANIAMGFVLLNLNRDLAWWLEAVTLDRVYWLAVSISAGVATYFVVLLALGLRPSRLGIRPH